MSENDNDVDGLVIRIPSSFFEKKEAAESEASRITGDYHFFERTNIAPIRVKRNTEHGLSEIQSLGFKEQDQRLKVFDLLDTPTLYNRMPALLNFIYQLGCEPDGEKRYYASVAVGELACKQPFVDLKEHVILPWAKSSQPLVRVSAALALSYLLEQERYITDVLMLLKHWASIKSALTDTALLTYYWVSQSYPDESFEAVKTILSQGRIFYYPRIIDIFGNIYDFDPALAIEKLHEWLIPTTHSDLCWMAGLLFFTIVRLDDVAEDDDLRKKVVEMIFTLWDDSRMPMHQEMQEQTTSKVESWAREALALWDKDNPETFETYRVLFQELYQRYEGQRRNRLKFHLDQWQKYREREQVIAARRGRDVSEGDKQQISFLDLIA
jgi:hypothetical protein